MTNNLLTFADVCPTTADVLKANFTSQLDRSREDQLQIVNDLCIILAAVPLTELSPYRSALSDLQDQTNVGLQSVNDGYPTVAMVIDEVHSRFGTDSDAYDEETVEDAISKWDAQFADDTDWYSEEIGSQNDIRDSLRFEVEDALGLEF